MSRELQRPLTAAEINSLTIMPPGKTLRPFFSGPISRVPFCFSDEPIPATGAPAKFTFAGQLRPAQIDVVKQAFSSLAAKRAVLIATHVGFGKTVMALYILSQVKFKTVILVDLLELATQWMAAIETYLPGARAKYLTGKLVAGVNWAEHDIVVMNIVNVPKLTSSTYEVGLLIVDETHSMMTPTLCPNLLYFAPQYLVGLSATPYRLDESHQLIELFYGDNIIRKTLSKTHTVYRVNTGVEIVYRGIWNEVLQAQATNSARNELIAEIVAARPNLNFLVLCKQVEHILALQQALAARGVESEAVFGARHVVGDARVLIGTYKKLGKGFDRAKFNALILATDIKSYFIQALGRVFRDPAAQPVIFDLVDKNFILEQHWRARRAVYIETGGIINTI